MNPCVLRASLATLLLSMCFVPAGQSFPRPRPGIEVGLLGSKPAIPGEPLPTGATLAYGFSVAGTLGFGLPHGLGLETGLRYSGDLDRREVDFTYSSGVPATFHATSTVTFRRLGIPLRLRTGWPAGHGLSFEASAEPQYLLVARAENETSVIAPGTATRPARGPAAPVANIFEDVGTFDGGDVTSMVPRWNLMLGAGIGWEFALSRATAVTRIRYQQSVSDQTKSPEFKRYPRVGELSFGFRW
jgi:hypothetical protein